MPPLIVVEEALGNGGSCDSPASPSPSSAAQTHVSAAPVHPALSCLQHFATGTHSPPPPGMISAGSRFLSFFSYLLIYLFGCTRSQMQHACGIQFPDQGSNPGSLHWEFKVLTAGPPGESLLGVLSDLSSPGHSSSLPLLTCYDASQFSLSCSYLGDSDCWVRGLYSSEPARSEGKIHILVFLDFLAYDGAGRQSNACGMHQPRFCLIFFHLITPYSILTFPCLFSFQQLSHNIIYTL